MSSLCRWLGSVRIWLQAWVSLCRTVLHPEKTALPKLPQSRLSLCFCDNSHPSLSPVYKARLCHQLMELSQPHRRGGGWVEGRRQRHGDGERDRDSKMERHRERKERNEGPDLSEVDGFLTFLIMSLDAQEI